MIEFVPYEPKHFLYLSKRCLENSFKGDETIAHGHALFPATTVLRDSVPIACFGIHKMWDGVGEAWAMFDKDIMSVAPRELAVLTGKALDDMSAAFHRIQCVVSSENTPAMGFVEHYGFKREGVLEKYSPDKHDFVIYARVKE